MVTQSSGKIILAGKAGSGFAVSRLKSDGSDDPSFPAAATRIIRLTGSLDFGTVTTGGTATRTLTIHNDGTALLSVASISVSPPFSASFSGNIPELSSRDVMITFAPTTAGPFNETLTVNSNKTSGSNTASVLGAGVLPPAPEIGVEQPTGTNLTDGASSVSFGSVTVGGNMTLSFTVKNTGNANLIGVGVAINGTNAGDFSLVTSPSGTVSPGGSTTFTVRFAPGVAAARTAALRISSNDANENPFDINLNGTGLPAPEIAVEQPAGTNLTDGISTINFGNVNEGSNASLSFTVKNTGNANLTGVAATISGANANDYAVTSIPAGTVTGPSGSTTFTVRFAPQGTGPRPASLRIASNDADENPFDVNLTGTGTTPPTPEIAVEGPDGLNLMDGVSTVSYGRVHTAVWKDLTFTVKNRGGVNLTGVGVTITGTNANDFTVTSSPGSTIGANGSITFTVRFVPGVAWMRMASLHVASNDAEENPFDVDLTGTGVIDAPLAVDSSGTGIWTIGGDAPWAGLVNGAAHDGVDFATSGVIGDNQESWMETQVQGPGTVNFWYRVLSQSGYGDYLRFYVDGVQRFIDGGDIPWSKVLQIVGPGSHTLRWS